MGVTVGVEEIQRHYGELIFAAHLPPPGSRTQPIDAGYMANAWLRLRHPDYDRLREILNTIGETVSIASRLESATKELLADMIVSDAAVQASGLALPGAMTHDLQVAGREKPLRVHKISDVAAREAAA